MSSTIFNWYRCSTIFWCKLQQMFRAPWVAEMWVLGCMGFSVSVFQDSVCTPPPFCLATVACGLARIQSVPCLLLDCYFAHFFTDPSRWCKYWAMTIPPVHHERPVSPSNGRLIRSSISSLLTRKIGIVIPSPISFWSWCSPDQ